MENATSKVDFLAISSDGWTDINGASIINVIVHTPKPFHFNSINASGESHTGEYIAGIIRSIWFVIHLLIIGILSKEIEKLGKHKVVAVVTDHAANMRKAWDLLSIKYPWILFEGCKGHMVNLAARDVCEKTAVKSFLDECSKIVRFFRYH